MPAKSAKVNKGASKATSGRLLNAKVHIVSAAKDSPQARPARTIDNMRSDTPIASQGASK